MRDRAGPSGGRRRPELTSAVRRLPRWVAAVVALTGCMAVSAADLQEPAPPRAVQEKDFRTFLAWFEGEFDSNQQVAFADELGIPKDAVPERTHSIFKRADPPAFGEHVFYVEQYLDGDPAQIYRQRLYSFSLDDAEQAIKLVSTSRPT